MTSPDSLEPLTGACQRYLDEITSLVSFVSFVGSLAAGDRLGLAPRLGAFSSPLLFEMVYTRAVDGFLIYVSDLLALVFATRPETLRSSEQVPIQEVLRHETIDDLVAYLVERRVDRLASRSLRDLSEDTEKALKLPLFPEESELSRAAAIVGGRNLIVHNRGVIDRRYLGLVPGGGSVGDALSIDSTEVIESLAFLVEHAVELDGRAAKKFGLLTAPAVALPPSVAEAIRERAWPATPELIDPDRPSES